MRKFSFQSFLKPSPLRRSLYGVLGLGALLRLGGLCSFHPTLSHWVFGGAGVWQLYFAETATLSPSPKKPASSFAQARYAWVRGFPILCAYFVGGLLFFRFAVPLWMELAPNAYGVTALKSFQTSLLLKPYFFKLTPTALFQALFGLLAISSGAFLEEFFWRGFVQPIWCAETRQRGHSENLGVVLQAFAFGAAHVATHLDGTRILTVFPGFWFGRVARDTEGILAPTLLHIACNLTAIFLLSASAALS